MAYTPGPWKWFNYPDGRKLLAASTRAVIHCPEAAISCEPADERLIAAAPDLLAALKRAVKVIRDWESMGVMTPASDQSWLLYQQSPEMKQINAAIKKAED